MFPLLLDSRLSYVDMGINEIGDRLKILQQVEAYLRGMRNRQRQADILVFRNWTLSPFASWTSSSVHISESAIVVHTPHPLLCSVDVDNIDISSVLDLSMDAGMFRSVVKVRTSDPSWGRKGGVLKFFLPNDQATKVLKTLRALVLEDQKKLGRTGGLKE